MDQHRFNYLGWFHMTSLTDTKKLSDKQLVHDLTESLHLRHIWHDIPDRVQDSAPDILANN